MKQCPCGSTAPYNSCCGPFHSCQKKAETAEELMRSRYSAYVLRETAYILNTWHPSTRPASLAPAETVDWKKLTILKKESGDENSSRGLVEFKAISTANQKMILLHEASQFIKDEGEWYYVDGEILTNTVFSMNEIGRNEPCPCGSDKKFKKCCRLNLH